MTSPLPKEPQSNEQKKIIRLYAAFGVSLLISLIPTLSAVLLFLLFITTVIIYAYYLRSKAQAGDLIENHASFIIRTFWIANLFAVVTLIAGSTYMLSVIDNTPLEACTNQIINMGMNAASMGNAALMELFQPCIDNYIETNWSVLMVTVLITALPILLYLVIRYVRGLSRALKGYRIAAPKAWL